MKLIVKKQDVIQKYVNIKSFNELEKVIDIDMGIKDKEQKKYVIFTWIVEHSEGLNALSL